MTTGVTIQYETIQADGVDVFYRSAGDPQTPVILLLHGFPASSFQFRNLIPLLAPSYRVIAPDLPGFGFTVVPDSRKYEYTFDNLAKTIQAFVDVLGMKSFAIYVFDYGAPVGFRLAVSKPSQITAIISQNGNAYKEGLDATFWAPVIKYWKSTPHFDPSLSSPEAQAILPFLSESVTAMQYTKGVPKELLSRVDPAAYTLDSSLLKRKRQDVIQLSLFYDYQSNVTAYPIWHEYFRKESPKVLVMWGKNDFIFVPPGAEAFQRDLKDVEIHFVDGGHFVLETHVEVYGRKINEFLGKILQK